MTTTEVTVTLSRKAEVLDKFAKFQAKALRLGAPAATLTWGEPREAKGITFTGKEYTYLVQVATLTGEVAKLAGWTFVASLEHPQAGAPVAGNIIRSLEGSAELPVQYRTAEAVCDHCGYDRRRNNTYVLLSDDGVYTQVGSTCLMDFLGTDPKTILWYAEALNGFGDDDDEFGYGGGGGYRDVSLRSCLEGTSLAIQAFGWKSKKSASIDGGESTAGVVQQYFFGSRKDQEDLDKAFKGLTVNDAEIAAAIEWAQGLATKSNASEYEFNISVIASNGRVGDRGFGFACSILSSYLRTVEQLALQAAKAPSEFVGVKGAKGVRVEDVAITSVRHFDPYTYNGPTRLLVSMLAGDNVLKVWTDSGTNFGQFATDNNRPETFTLVGQVKDHEIYNGRKSTLFTRVKVA